MRCLFSVLGLKNSYEREKFTVLFLADVARDRDSVREIVGESVDRVIDNDGFGVVFHWCFTGKEKVAQRTLCPLDGCFGSL